jgi:hypothetical protein
VEGNRQETRKGNGEGAQPQPRAPGQGQTQSPGAGPAHPPSGTVLPACSPPDVRTPPTFSIPFRRPIVLKTLSVYDAEAAIDPAQGPPTLACAAISRASVTFVLDPLFTQVWTLNQLSIGDLASTIGLAPGEQLTIEVQQTQRKVFDQSVVDSTDSLQSTDSQTSDKEAVNVTRSSTKTEGWHVDATGTVGTGSASLNLSAGYSSSLTQSFQQSINRVSEATKKSSASLKTLHQIQVHGVTETLVNNRMTRVLKNPYFDRTLAVNIFHLIKDFSVQTELTEVRAAIVFTVDDIDFDAQFVVSNSDFLRASLLDNGLLDKLDTALLGAQPPVLTGDLATAARIARRALQLLFADMVNMFHMPANLGTDPNKPSVSYSVSDAPSFSQSGLGDAHETNFGMIFTTLNFYYTLTTTDATGNTVDPMNLPDQDAIQIAASLAADLKDKMALLLTDPKGPTTSTDIKDIIDDQQLTEGMRRMFGFTAMVNGMLAPLLQPATADATVLQQQYAARSTLEQLIQHLRCNRTYYIQAFLQYLSSTTKNQAIAQFARDYLMLADIVNADIGIALQEFEPDGAFVAQNSVIVPARDPLYSDGDGIGLAALGRELFQDPSPVTIPVPPPVQVEVPADGVHLEVAPGGCILPAVPPPASQVNLSVQGAQLSVTQ